LQWPAGQDRRNFLWRFFSARTEGGTGLGVVGAAVASVPVASGVAVAIIAAAFILIKKFVGRPTPGKQKHQADANDATEVAEDAAADIPNENSPFCAGEGSFA